MTTKSRIVTKYGVNDKKYVEIYETQTPTLEGKLALDFITRWGMVASVEDGVDQTGRAKFRLLTPSEVVERAFDTADIAATCLRERGWMVDLPDLEEVNNG